jgi:hypothetical protein
MPFVGIKEILIERPKGRLPLVKIYAPGGRLRLY